MRPNFNADVLVWLDPEIGWSRTMQTYPPLPETGFIRLRAIIAPAGPIPVGKSTWWQGVRDGRFPKPVKLGPKTTAWRVEDIRELIDRLGR
jgi:predicted DNA-binding transcriptional regulator AlpA